MLTKHIFIVRHGETVDNESGVFSNPDTPLSSDGEKQARSILDDCAVIPFQRIVTSPLKRARQTAEIIAENSGVPVIENNLFTELRHPSKYFGRHRNDGELHTIKRQLIEHSDDPKWHHSDEENYHEFKWRIGESIHSLLGYDEEYILVVTHSHTIKMLVAQTLLDSMLTPELYYKMHHTLTTENTGINYFTLTENHHELITFNRINHLSNFIHDHET